MNADKFKSLHYHASGGTYLEVQSLLNEGVDPDGENSGWRTPLMLAVKESHTQVADLLIKAGADLHHCDDAGWTVLHYASRNAWVEVAQSLVDKRVSIDAKIPDGRTPLMIAIEYSCKEVAELLIKSGADIHCRDMYGWTVLHYASSMEGIEWVEIVQYLVNKKFDLDVKTHDGRTPLMIAAQFSSREVVLLLINSGADIHCSDNFGWTALHFTSSRGWVEGIQCLVNKGVVLDVKTSDDGQTPLLKAAQWSHREVVELLSNSGADIQCCDNDGWTALHHASSNFDGLEMV